jgi:hypothetical protein
MDWVSLMARLKNGINAWAGKLSSGIPDQPTSRAIAALDRKHRNPEPPAGRHDRPRGQALDNGAHPLLAAGSCGSGKSPLFWKITTQCPAVLDNRPCCTSSRIIAAVTQYRGPYAPAHRLEGTASISNARDFLKLFTPSSAPLKCPNRTMTRS